MSALAALLRIEFRALRREPSRCWAIVLLVAVPIAAIVGGASSVRAITDGGGASGGFEQLVVFVVGGIGLVEAALVVAAAFAIGLRRRRREIGLVRASGAPAAAVHSAIVASALALAFLGGLLGAAVGALVATVVHPRLARWVGHDVGALRFEPEVVLGAIGLGLLASAFAVLIPAQRAVQMPVRVALDARRPPAGDARSWLALGVTLCAAAVLLVGVGSRLESAAGWTAILAGSAAGLLGFGALSPWILARFARLATPLPLAWRLAVRDAGRFRSRDGPAVTAVLAATAISVTIATVLGSLRTLPDLDASIGATERLVLALTVAAGLAVLLVATALSAADAADDLRVLEAVGAPPRVLRRRAAAHTAYLALLGCALAVPAGLIPAFGVVALADIDVAFVVPWGEVALAVLTLPLLAHAATLMFGGACGLPNPSDTPRTRLQMLLTLALLAPVQGTSDDLVLESYTASLDGGRTLEGRIGRISVPERHAEPDGPKIEIAFAVYDARTDDPGPPIYFLAGGPGAPGIDLAAELAANEELDLLARHAVVGIDQRGTGQSIPNLADGPSFRYSLPLDRPVTRDEMAAAFREAVAEAAAHWSEEGVDLAAYNSAESADDVDAVRRALGHEKVVLWGTSYGSHLGLAALRRHGEHVERAVLSKVEGPDDTFKLPSLVQERLDLVAALIAADPELGERFPDFVGSIRTLLERIAAEPVTVPTVLDGEEVEVVVGPLDVQVLLSSALGFAPQVATLPMAVALMEEGEFRHVARFVAGLRRGEVGSAMAIATDCASGSSEARRERLADELGDPANVLGDGISAPFFPEACAGCPDPAVGTALRAPLRSDVPVLFVSGELDARTPPENVEALLDGFGAAVHVVATHTGHEGTEWGSDEFVGVVRSFLAGESVRSVTVELPPIAFRPVRPK